MNEHRHNLQLVFDRLRSAGLMLHPGKCDFAKTETKFLGYILSGEAIRVDPDKTKKNYRLSQARIGEGNAFVLRFS